MFHSMAFTGAITSGNDPAKMASDGPTLGPDSVVKPSRKTKLFKAKNPGAAGKLGKSSSLAESLSKLRGKGAVA